MQLEAEHFDPYQILDLPLRANATVIKSHYRRLSLKHHPDKNPGNRRQANKKFNQVAKAYQVQGNGDTCGKTRLTRASICVRSSSPVAQALLVQVEWLRLPHAA